MVKIKWWLFVIILLVTLITGSVGTGFYLTKRIEAKYKDIIATTTANYNTVKAGFDELSKRNNILESELNRTNGFIKDLTGIIKSSTIHVNNLNESISKCIEGADKLERINQQLTDLVDDTGKSK